MQFQNKDDFIYGEIDFLHFYTLLKIFKVNTGGEFWDLGCGIGKALVCAAFTDCFSKIRGVELLASLHKECSNVINSLYKKNLLEVEQNITSLKTDFELYQNDLLKTEWTKGDLIFISDRCFSSEVK